MVRAARASVLASSSTPAPPTSSIAFVRKSSKSIAALSLLDLGLLGPAGRCYGGYGLAHYLLARAILQGSSPLIPTIVFSRSTVRLSVADVHRHQPNATSLLWSRKPFENTSDSCQLRLLGIELELRPSARRLVRGPRAPFRSDSRRYTPLIATTSIACLQTTPSGTHGLVPPQSARHARLCPRLGLVRRVSEHTPRSSAHT